jgi:hypothetical protein
MDVNRCKTRKKEHGKALSWSDCSTMAVLLVGNALNEQLELLLHCPKLD